MKHNTVSTMDDDYERTLCIKNEVFVYKIPPRQSARGYRAADWKLDAPDWTGRFRIVTKGKACVIKFEDRLSGELFAKSLIESHPSPVVEAVMDSSRYFVVKIQDEGERHAFIGIGFTDRGDSFDFNVTLQDYFKKEKVVEEIANEEPAVPLDLGFKAGQTIKINLGNKSTGDRPKPKVGGSIGLLPPPPGSITPLLAPPPACSPAHQTVPSQQSQTLPLFNQQSFAPPPVQQNQPATTQQGDWGDFSSSNSSNSNSGGGNWVSF